MNILFVTDLCPVIEEENLPVTLLEFILDFKKLGHNVVLFRPNVVPNVLLRGRKILKEGIYDYKGIKCINKNYFTPFFTLKDFDFLKNENFEVILSHMPSGILAANKISKKFNIPYFAAVHSSDITVLKDFKYSFLKNAMKKAYIEAKMVLPRSYWLADEIKKIIPNIKTALIPSGIDASFVQSEIKETKDIKRIFSAGALIKRKNFDSLIKASARTGVELIIAGEGSDKKRLQKLAEKLSADVKFLGKRPKNEVLNRMRNADLFILPSKKETFGMVYLEALSCGAVVVCSENSGMAGFIKDEFNGFITKTDEKSLTKTIKRIQKFKNLDLIKKNALKTAEEMEKTNMAKNYLKNILF